MFSWCNPGISNVYFHAISVESTRVHLFDTCVNSKFFPEKTLFNIYVEYMLFTNNTHVKRVITVGAKAR